MTHYKIATRTPKPATKVGRQSMPTRTRSRQGRIVRGEHDAGNAVPPRVAMVEPEPMYEEAETVLENLQAHLRPTAKRARS